MRRGAGGERLHALLDQAATYYTRTLWETEAGSLARDYLTGRGLGEEVCREFRLGLALGGNSLARKASAKGFTTDELRAAGLQRASGADYFARRLLFPLADARGRVVGFQARKLHDDDPLQAKYVNTPESELFHKGAVVYGLDRSRARDRPGGPCVRRRGEHRRDRAAPGRFRACRRLHGDGAHRAAAHRARPADEASLARIRRRRRRRVGDAPRDGARGAPGLRRARRRACRRESTPPTTRPASSASSRRPSRISSTAFGSRSTAPRIARPRSRR